MYNKPFIREEWDEIDSPKHYTQGGIECVDYIRDYLSEEEYRGWLRGNITKYLHRFKNKGGLQDLHKAKAYLVWLIELEEES